MYSIQPMDNFSAKQIADWSYPEPWTVYSFRGDEQVLSELLAGGYHAVFDEVGELVGYFCFGEPARVPGGITAGVYDSDAVDIGLGIRPDLSGKGLGLQFLQAGMRYATQRLGYSRLRLSVLAWNERAIKVYERAGFAKACIFASKTPRGTSTFILMLHVQ